jgi:hypothetical protein
MWYPGSAGEVSERARQSISAREDTVGVGDKAAMSA